MGRKYFALELNTARINSYVEDNQLLDTMHPSIFLRLRTHIDCDLPGKIFTNVFADTQIAKEDKKEAIVGILQRQFLAELKRYGDVSKDPNIKNLYEKLDAKNDLAGNALASFVLQLDGELKAKKTALPEMLVPLATFLINIHNLQDDSENAIQAVIQATAETLNQERQETTLQDGNRKYYLDNREMDSWETLKLNLEKKLHPVLNDYFSQYANQKGFAHVGNLTINDMINPTAVGKQESQSLITIINPNEFYFVTYVKYRSWIGIQTSKESKEIVAATCSVVRIKNTNPNSEDGIAAVVCEMPHVLFEVYNVELLKSLRQGWLQNAKQKLLKGEQLASYEKDAIEEWLEQFHEAAISYNYLGMSLTAILGLELISKRKHLDAWLKEHQQKRYLKITSEELCWVLENRIEVAGMLLEDFNVYMRLLLEEKSDFQNIPSVSERMVELAEYQLKFQQFLTAAKGSKCTKTIIPEDEEPLFYISSLHFYIKNIKMNSPEEENVLAVITNIQFVEVLELSQYLKLILCGNVKVAQALLAPWLYARGSFWQRLTFSAQHPCHLLDNEDLIKISLMYPALWEKNCPVFGRRSWFKESKLGQWIFGEPLRYQLTTEDYKSLWSRASKTLKDNILTLAKNDAKLRKILLTTDVREIKNSLAPKKIITNVKKPTSRPSREANKIPQRKPTASSSRDMLPFLMGVSSHGKMLKRMPSNRSISTVTRELLFQSSDSLIAILQDDTNTNALEEVILYFLSEIDVRAHFIKNIEIIKCILDILNADNNQLVLGLIAQIFDYTTLGKFPVYIYTFVKSWQAQLVLSLKRPITKTLSDKDLIMALEEGSLFELKLLFRTDPNLIKRTLLMDLDWQDNKLRILGPYLIERYLQQPNSSLRDLYSLFLQMPKAISILNAVRQTEIFNTYSGKDLYYIYTNTSEDVQLEISKDINWVSKIIMEISPTELPNFLEINITAKNDLINFLRNEYEEKSYIKMVVRQQPLLLEKIFYFLSEESKTDILGDIPTTLELITLFDENILTNLLQDPQFKSKIYSALKTSPKVFTAFWQKFDKEEFTSHRDKIVEILLMPSFFRQVILDMEVDKLQELCQFINLGKLIPVIKGEQNSDTLEKLLQKIDFGAVFWQRYDVSKLDKEKELEILEFISIPRIAHKLIESLNSDQLNKFMQNGVFKEKVYLAMKGEEYASILEKFLQKVDIETVKNSETDIRHLSDISAGSGSEVEKVLTSFCASNPKARVLGTEIIRRSPSPKGSPSIPTKKPAILIEGKSFASQSTKKHQVVGMSKSSSFNSEESLQSLYKKPEKSPDIKLRSLSGSPPTSDNSNPNSDAENPAKSVSDDESLGLQRGLEKVQSTGTKTSASSTDNEEISHYAPPDPDQKEQYIKESVASDNEDSISFDSQDDEQTSQISDENTSDSQESESDTSEPLLKLVK